MLVEDDAALVARLRGGDESAFVELVRRHQPALLRLAESTVGSRDVAQEATQDTWLAVLKGIDNFEGRSSFKTWLFHILLNRARTARYKEDRAGRTVADPLDGKFDSSGAWITPPEPWADRVADKSLAAQLAERVKMFLPQLPESQRQVIVLRDVEGMDAAMVRKLTGLSDGNQRVLLHRGRTKLRELLAAEAVEL